MIGRPDAVGATATASGDPDPAPAQGSSDWQPIRPSTSQNGSSVSIDKAPGPEKKSFGVRSYLHKFYENKRPDYDEAIYENEEEYLTPPPKYPCAYSTSWKKLLLFGIVLAVLGLTVLLVTHAIPLHRVIVGYQQGAPLVDQKAAFLQKEVQIGTIAGLCLILLGGIMIACSVLIPSLFKLQDEYPPDHVIRVPVNAYGYTKISTKDDSIPSSTKVANVQPEKSSK